ncbi:porin family protein [Mariniflexile litorale]|uniref:Porin family protein n=1 Tax=Mariniflexile litorale TaxID=3045158 RepID=A0AAU7EIZ4_9FLAO|nr:porin family protein [Mariniflexile sp. KMM 9835]MDQ8211008.1 porin family protein [Mariniflexile sp. KMM 9835]
MMKKIFILSVIVIGTFFKNTHAQTVNFGAKAGVNISTFHGNRSSNPIDRNSLVGVHAGFIAEARISDFFALQPELLYSRVGVEEENVVKFRLDYIIIPIMAKFYLVDKLSVDVGPQFGFLINDIAKFNDDDAAKFDTDASTFEFAINTGIGINISEKWFSQVRYSFGITTISENPDIKNGVLQLSIGHKF